MPYNLLDRDVERELLPMAEAVGMSVTAWAPLAAGKLSGATGSRVDPAALTVRERAAADVVASVAGELGARPAQVALVWTRHNSPAVATAVRGEQCRATHRESGRHRADAARGRGAVLARISRRFPGRMRTPSFRVRHRRDQGGRPTRRFAVNCLAAAR
ncbi:aldo/keto reductase [Nocardia xishanensis]|uniref:aldo/keto reductase n=1 Tax=Nocardia xishanensis TaxID=238964 RepID=UPI003440C291